MEVFQNASASIKCVRDSTKGEAVFYSTSSKTTGTLYFQINLKWINLTLCYYVGVGVDFSWCLSCEIFFFFIDAFSLHWDGCARSFSIYLNYIGMTTLSNVCTRGSLSASYCIFFLFSSLTLPKLCEADVLLKCPVWTHIWVLDRIELVQLWQEQEVAPCSRTMAAVWML